MEGLMQNVPLSVSAVLRHARRAHPSREIVGRFPEGGFKRYNYDDMAARAEALAHVLVEAGIRPGDRVASLAWNTHWHLEMFFAVPGIGAVLHTVNPRLFEEQIVYILNHAQSRALFFETSFRPLAERLAPRLETVEFYVELTASAVESGDELGVLGYETLLARHEAPFKWPGLDENTGAVLCYTSGTTGDPKGVLYSHRSLVLHALAASNSGAFGVTAFDCIMPCASMYHATAWGFPYIAALNGAKLVLPGDRMDGESLNELIMHQAVTISAGVPTIWTHYLSFLRTTDCKLDTLKRIFVGGSALPASLAEAFEREYGVKMIQIWGMTETSPIGVVGTATPALIEQCSDKGVSESLWNRQGRLQFGMELRIIDEAGIELPWDGKTTGALQVRGPWVVARYFRAECDALTADGWFDTGDVAAIDPLGYVRITDRRKDVIKSGGEWISSIELENLAAAYPGVRAAAVIGVPHPEWDERPLLIVEPETGETPQAAAILDHLRQHVAKWWLPDAVIFEKVPLTAVGKIDKKRLRSRFRDFTEAGRA